MKCRTPLNNVQLQMHVKLFLHFCHRSCVQVLFIQDVLKPEHGSGGNEQQILDILIC